MGGDAYDVFVSYSRSDEDGAAELNSWLCSQGLSTFSDRSKLRPGLRWVPALEDAIGRSRAVVVLVGKHGIGKDDDERRNLQEETMRRFMVHLVTEVEFEDGDEASDKTVQNYQKQLSETVRNAAQGLSLRTIQGTRVETVSVTEIKGEL